MCATLVNILPIFRNSPLNVAIWTPFTTDCWWASSWLTVMMGEPRTDGEMARISLTWKMSFPSTPRQMEKVILQTSSRFSKDLHPHFLGYRGGSGHPSAHFLWMSVGKANNKTATSRRTFDGHFAGWSAMFVMCPSAVSKRRMLCDIGLDGSTGEQSICVPEHRVRATKIATSGHRAWVTQTCGGENFAAWCDLCHLRTAKTCAFVERANWRTQRRKGGTIFIALTNFPIQWWTEKVQDLVTSVTIFKISRWSVRLGANWRATADGLQLGLHRIIYNSMQRQETKMIHRRDA